MSAQGMEREGSSGALSRIMTMGNGKNGDIVRQLFAASVRLQCIFLVF